MHLRRLAARPTTAHTHLQRRLRLSNFFSKTNNITRLPPQRELSFFYGKMTEGEKINYWTFIKTKKELSFGRVPFSFCHTIHWRVIDIQTKQKPSVGKALRVYTPNKSLAFWREVEIISSAVVPRISAIFSAAKRINPEWQSLPLNGTGARYGQSVSKRILS